MLCGLIFVVMLIALCARSGRTAGDPHLADPLNCQDCHTMHDSLQHDYDGNAPPVLGVDGPYDYLLQNSLTFYGLPLTRGMSSRAGLSYFQTSRGLMTVTLTDTNVVFVGDNRGLPLVTITRFVTDAVSGRRVPGKPYDVVLRRDGTLLITDSQCNYIEVLDIWGKSLQQIWPGDLLGLPREAEQARCLTLDANNNLYVSVSGQVNAILVLTPDYRVKQKISELSGGISEISNLTVDADGVISATSYPDNVTRVYSKAGMLLRVQGGRGFPRRGL